MILIVPLIGLANWKPKRTGATERQLAAEHRKILHELRRDWLTTVCQSIFVALVTVVASLAMIGAKDGPGGKDRS